MNNKAAMFGLDARIALAIFGALSIISGASLYNAIENSQVTALATDLNDVGKAYQAYVLDTKKDIDHSGYNKDTPSLALIQNIYSLRGWDGPYVSYSQSSDWANGVDHPKYDYFYFTKANNETWVGQNPNTGNACNGTKKCHVWTTLRMGLTDSNITAIVKKLDEHFDGSDGATKGRFRYDNTSNTYTYIRLYLGPTIKF